MSLRLYMDEHIHAAITQGLRTAGVDVLTVQEDGMSGISDPELLDRATELGRVLFSQDSDLLAEAAMRQSSNAYFAGVLYGHRLNLTIGEFINDLELIAQACEEEELANTVVYLPLR